MDFLYTDETLGLDQPYDLVYKMIHTHETNRTIAGRYRPDLAAAEHSASSAKRCLGKDAWCKHFTEPFGNRTDHALSAHADRPQMNKKAPCPLAGQGVSVKTYAGPDKSFRFSCRTLFARYRADGLLLRHKSFRYIRRSFRALIERCR